MSTEFVGIELNLMGADGVRRDLENLDRLLNSLRGRKKFDMGLNEARQQVVAYKGEIERLRREQSKFAKGSDEWKRYAALIDEARQKLWNAQQAVREFGQASREAGRTFQQTFNAISSKVAHVGSAMQSFGNAMTQLTSPFRRLTSGIIMGAGFKAFNQFTEGIENSFTRADVMRKYPRVMEALGYSAKEAQDSIDKLDASVQGLPTSLDEIVGMSQRFTATVGDLTKGTDLAIAANNAFLASMSTETQRYQGMMQLQDVIGGKKLNAREWYSLANSMMPAIRMMGESLGYEGQQLEDYVAAVQQGKIANEEFLDTLIKAGTDDNGKIRQIAMESLDTWEAFFSRIRTAASRLGFKGIIEPLNTLVETVTGGKFKSVNLLLDDFVINRIDKMQSSVKKWIEAHPEQITKFFKDLSQIKIGNFFRGYAKGLEWMVGLVEKLGTALGKHPKLMGFLGGFFGVGGMVGRMSTIFGGLLKGTRHIWAGIGTVGSFLLKGRFGKLGIFGKIASIFGKKKDLETVAETAKEIPSIATTFKGAFSALGGLIKAAGAVTLVSGAGFVAFESAKSILKNLKEMVDLVNGGGWDNVGYVGAGVITAIGTFTEIFNAIGTMLGPKGLLAVAIASAATALVSGTFWADTEMIKRGLKNIHDTIKEFDSIGETITSMKGLAGISTSASSKLQASVDAIRGITDILMGKNGGPSSRGEYSRGLPVFSKRITNSLKNLANAVGDIKATIEALNDLATIGINQNIATKMEQISRTLDSVIRVFSGGTDSAGNAHYAFPKVSEEQANSVKNLADAITNLHSIVDNLNALSTIGINQNIDIKLGQIKKAVTTVQKTFPTLLTSIAGPKNLQENTNGLAEGIRGLRRVVWHINQLAGLTVNNDGLSAVVEQIRTALENLQQLSGILELDIEVKLASGFEKSVKDVIDKIKKEKKRIEDQTKKEVSFEIPVNVRFSVVSNFSSVLSMIIGQKNRLRNAGSNNDEGFIGPPKGPAKGGLIYRAHGGGVPWKRIGTDTVPAMLTPGEYVHNKRAVSMFGIDFMRKVNNLDMKGAMNELMHRAGHMANINRGTNITNNYNNNQKVVINNSNAGAGYTFKAASRFVGAF